MNRVLLTMLLGSLMSACSGETGGSSLTSEESSSSGGNSAGGNSASPSCFAGTRCECGNLSSETICEDGVAVCSCDICPNFEPAPLPLFQPCGGEPFGRWRLVSSDWSGYKLPLSSSGSCSLHGTEEIASGDIRFEFRSGGDAVLAQSGTHLSFRTGPDCGGPCDEFEGVRATLACSSSGCGTCDCDFEMDPLQLDGSWSRTETSIVFKPENFSPVNFDYCVTDDQLTLRDEQGRVMTLVQTGASGTPAGCSSRTSVQCSLGGGCRLGSCQGSATCAEATSENDCGVLSGCTWNPEACSGTAHESCDLEDYGRVPGCVFNENTSCQGTRVDCIDIEDDALCRQSPGCEVEPGCTGGARACSTFNNAKSSCLVRSGCSWQDPGSCVGQFQCEDIFWSTCEKLSVGCTQTTCSGEAAACSDLTIFECEAAAGCVPSAP